MILSSSSSSSSSSSLLALLTKWVGLTNGEKSGIETNKCIIPCILHYTVHTCNRLSPIVFCFNFFTTGLERRAAKTNFSIIDHRTTRPAQLAELPHSEFGPELFPHSTYVKFFVTFATKVPFLTFCDKI